MPEMMQVDFEEIGVATMTDETMGARALYGITVAAELVGLGEQTLRLYERKGLLTPSRTSGGTRRYSNDDLDLLRRVTALLDEGVNLAGARRILELEAANHALHLRITELSA